MAGNKGKGKLILPVDTSEGRRRVRSRKITISARREAGLLSQEQHHPQPNPLDDSSSQIAYNLPTPDFDEVTAAIEWATAVGEDSLVSISEDEANRIDEQEDLMRGCRKADRDEMEEGDEEDDNLDDADYHGDEEDDNLGRREVGDGTCNIQVRRGARGRFVAQSSSTNAATSKKKRKKGSSSGKTSTDDWIIRSAMPGGPTLVDVIPSYGGHVAASLWEGIERSPVVQHLYTRPGHTKTLEKALAQLPLGARDLVERSGVHHVPGVMFPDFDIPLCAAFIERWQPDTNTFHLPFGEMTILLHDVQQILGLKVDGRIPWRTDVVAAADAYVDLFGSESLEIQRR